MSATRPARGRARRTEAVKRLKFRQSTYLLRNQRKESLGLKGVSNSEFAELLLHQNVERFKVKLMNHLVQLALREKVRNARNLNIFNSLSSSILIKSLT